MGKGKREGLIMIGRSISVAIVALLLLSALIPSLGSNQAIPPSDSIPILGLNQANAQETGLVEVDIPVRGTFLYAVPSQGGPRDGEVEAPAIVDLRANGILGDTTITMTYSGQISVDGYEEYIDVSTWIGLDGLFSSSSELLSIDELHRVPGAIASGYPFITAPVFNPGSEPHPTDILEDFYFGEGWSLTVPRDAMFLFICMDDSYYPDNLGNIQVTIDTRKDTDGDGLFDSWEKDGIDSDHDGTIDLVLQDADWQHKDIFVEVDYMDLCRPNPLAISDVQIAFSKAPVGNPDGRNGINLHVLVDQEIDRQLDTTWRDFDALKSKYFGMAADQTSSNKAAILEARKQVSHYCLFAYKLAEHNDTTNVTTLPGNSGIGELPGNDFMVTLGYTFESNPHYLGRMEQASVFMHELGHNLGLHHGGKDEINYKPNYLSVMNYMFQFNDLYPNRPLDYSRIELQPLNEVDLNEMDGVGVDYVSAGSGGWLFTGHKDPIQNKSVLSLLRPIDWDGDRHYNTSVQANVNNCTDWDYGSQPNELLNGYNDWGNVILPFQKSKNFADGAHYDCPEEITLEAMELMKESAQNYHDVALVNATPSSSVIYQNSTLDVTVNSVNLGVNNETAELSVYASTTLIAQKTISLERCNITSTVLRCDISTVPKGDQVITIRLSPVPGDKDVIDNNYTYGAIEFTGEAAPPPTDQSWPLIFGVTVTVVALIAIALFVVLRKRGKKNN